MGARGQKSKTTKTSQNSGGRRFRGEMRVIEGDRRNDDFSRRGIGDKIDVIGQKKRGRKRKK